MSASTGLGPTQKAEAGERERGLPKVMVERGRYNTPTRRCSGESGELLRSRFPTGLLICLKMAQPDGAGVGGS